MEYKEGAVTEERKKKSKELEEESTEVGVLKPIAKGVVESRDNDIVKFAPLFCCHWLPEMYIENLRMMEPIMNVEAIKETWDKIGLLFVRLSTIPMIGVAMAACVIGRTRRSFF